LPRKPPVTGETNGISKLSIDTRGARELTEAELNGVTGGIGIQREPTYHPAKVTVPDIKIEIS
jgi:hypothetical protein